MPSLRKKVKHSESDEDDGDVNEERTPLSPAKAKAGGRPKRSRRDNDGDEYEPNDDEEAEGEDEEEDYDDDEEDAAAAPSSPKRKKKAKRASNLTNSPMKDRNTNCEGKQAECGIIHEIYVENFMCHRKLSVKLCRNVNFIHGQNGSGKSAILAALQVCLGAGARRTHRARNLRDLVRKESGENCTGAKVRVTLLNRGADGFKPEIYGDRISVERSISLGSGYNGYKLLDASGKERSRSKKDLDAMLDQLNIQVENPVAVLDQEEAKKFLTGKAEDKYAFFTKATELERLDRVYANIHDTIIDQENSMTRAEEGLNPAIERCRKLEQEWNAFQELDKLEADVAQARALYGWALYSEKKCEVEDLERKNEKFTKTLEKRKAELKKAEESLNTEDDQEEKLKAELLELGEEANQAAQNKTNLENELRDLNKPIRVKERERSVVLKELDNAKRGHKSAIRRLEKERAEILANKEGSAEAERVRIRQIADLERQLVQLKERIEPVENEVNRHLQDYNELKPQAEDKLTSVKQTENQYRAVESNVRSLQSEDGSADIAKFGGNKCVKLHAKVAQLERARKFKGAVIGPVGKYIKVVEGKEKYAKLAETAIGPPGSLDKFVVTNQDDLKLLQRLRREVGCGARDCNVSRISEKAVRSKYATPAPPPGVETVTSVLSSDNAMAWNFLIDSGNIDQSALCDSKDDSESALLVSDNRGASIRGGKVKKVFFLPDGDHWETKGGLKTMISNDRKMIQTIGTDRREAIRLAKEDLRAVADELKRAKQESKGLEDALYDAKVRWNQSQKENKKILTGIKKAEDTLEQLKAEADESEQPQENDTTDLEMDVQEKETEVTSCKNREAALLQEIESLRPAVDEKRAEIDEVAARNQKVMDDLNAAEQKLEGIIRGNSRRVQNVENARAKIDKFERDVEGKRNELEEERERAADILLKARRMQYKDDYESRRLEAKMAGEEDSFDMPEEASEEAIADIEIVDVDFDPERAMRNINKKEKKLATQKSRQNLSESDPAAAKEKYFRAKKYVDEKMRQIETIKSNVESLKSDLHTRKKRWRQFRSHIADMTNTGFDEFLSKKKATGEVEFDHDRGQLNLIVQKDRNDESSQTKDVKALSGGERSFTTLSLLLAIGESLETPFRVMDEFDVFLDPVARKQAMETLVQVSQEMTHRQFIFITPQDVSSLRTTPLLKIFKMKRPERSSHVGGLQQQTLD